MLGRGFEKAFDVAAAGKVLADGTQHDDADARVVVDRFEHQAQLVALRHLDDVERRPIENHVGALAFGIDFDAKPVKPRQPRVGESHSSAHG